MTTAETTNETLYEHKGYKIHLRTRMNEERIDNRKKTKKTYGLKFAIRFQIERVELPNGDSNTSGAPFDSKIRRYFPNAHVHGDTNWLVSETGEHQNTKTLDLWVSFTTLVPKPSEIPTLTVAYAGVENEANKRLGGEALSLTARLLVAIREAIDVKIDDIARDQRRDDADKIARLLAQRADEAAKKRINYEAEMAALRAKLDVTRRQELADQVSELRAKAPHGIGIKLDERDVDPRSIEAGIKHAHEAFPGSGGPFESGPRRLTVPGEVT